LTGADDCGSDHPTRPRPGAPRLFPAAPTLREPTGPQRDNIIGAKSRAYTF